jgi:hypothetical protein
MSEVKKNKILFLSLLVLTAATIVVFVITLHEDRLDIDKNTFRVSDLKSIDEVRLLSNNDTVNLAFDGTAWMVNGKYEADRNMIQVLFATLQQVEPKRPVTGPMRDSLESKFATQSTSVQLLSDGNLVKTFETVGNKTKTTGYFRNSEDGEIYVMAIPGYRVYVAGVFELNTNGFRNKYVFGFNWQNFKSLKTHFSERPREDFDVSMAKNYFAIQGLAETDTTKLYNYLDEVAKLTIDVFSDRFNVDTIMQKPALEILVTDIASRKYQLRVYPSHDEGIMPGFLNGEPIGISASKIRPLVKGKSFFAKEKN